MVLSYHVERPRGESLLSISEQQVVHVCATVEKAPRCLSSASCVKQSSNMDGLKSGEEHVLRIAGDSIVPKSKLASFSDLQQ